VQSFVGSIQTVGDYLSNIVHVAVNSGFSVVIMESISQSFETYNSNSFTKGLLDASGIEVAMPSNTIAPGWGKPIPEMYFGK
jgi:hypothetical protein